MFRVEIRAAQAEEATAQLRESSLEDAGLRRIGPGAPGKPGAGRGCTAEYPQGTASCQLAAGSASPHSEQLPGITEKYLDFVTIVLGFY